MLTAKDVAELINVTVQDMPPDLKKLYDEEVLLMEKEMLTSQKTISIINHNKKTLPILDYMDSRNFLALALSGDIILWVYKGMAMIIPTARIENLARIMESIDQQDLKKTKSLKIEFTVEDAIILPKNIAAALLDD